MFYIWINFLTEGRPQCRANDETRPTKRQVSTITEEGKEFIK